ncbi:MAG TPA: hypothetical protein DDY14_14495 [Chromatiaceae bacterium]|jgi:hypothetical protein|nr:MAG: hypothetical protein N838_17550 [Thiohalocapsa sp. PB-PSB1]HBG96490.1 hypothetical protein [Chromatiaceae bacterium]HCS89201.1 hypothetical protein [Chromatiaceae bacterium]
MFAHTDAVQLFSVTKPPRVRLQFALLLVRLLAFAAIVVSSGCTTLIPTLIPTLIQDTEQGSWVDIAPGSSLTLNQDIRIAQDRARVFFVNGRARNFGASYQPSCALEVRRISRDGPQVISARSIGIDRIQSDWAQVVHIGRQPAARLRLVGHGGGDGGDAMIQTGFHFWLDDSRDRNLMRLTCLGILANPALAYPPTLADIRIALGRIATLDSVSRPR